MDNVNPENMENMETEMEQSIQNCTAPTSPQHENMMKTPKAKKLIVNEEALDDLSYKMKSMIQYSS